MRITAKKPKITIYTYGDSDTVTKLINRGFKVDTEDTEMDGLKRRVSTIEDQLKTR